MQAASSTLPAGLCILLAEDEPLIAIDTEATLLALGVSKVVHARTVAEALHKIEEERPGAAILDLRLGAEDSTALAQRLVELGIPFGFATGYVGDMVPEPFKDRPFLGKPFDSNQLADLLRAMLPTADPSRAA
jgi:DNA-binding NtrC family response regulator